jgi:hypothetical protein
VNKLGSCLHAFDLRSAKVGKELGVDGSALLSSIIGADHKSGSVQESFPLLNLSPLNNVFFRSLSHHSK